MKQMDEHFNELCLVKPIPVPVETFFTEENMALTGNQAEDLEGYWLTYIHTYIHTHLHTYIHTYIHTFIHIYISNPNRTSTLTDLHSLKYTYIHTYTHTFIYAYIHTYIHTIYTYKHTFFKVNMHIHSYICIHTYIYTGYRKCTYINKYWCMCVQYGMVRLFCFIVQISSFWK